MIGFSRRRLLASTLLANAALVVAPAHAQSGTEQSVTPALQNSRSGAPTASETEEIVVTGSLIRDPNVVSSSPVQVISQQEFELRQTNVAEDVLRVLPGAVPNVGSAVNNGNGGASFVDLRGLGPNRNIVLLDGNRVTPFNTTGQVDLNNIPLALIERVDALTGGAATTYGADAVSGVVNFITRRDFSGMEVNGSEQISGKGDGNYYRVDATIGANLAEDKGNIVLSLGYQKSNAIYQGDRTFSNTQYRSTSGQASGSDVTIPGEFILGNAQVQIDPSTGTLVPVFAKFNFNPYNLFRTPFKRFNIFAQGHYDVTDGIEVYGRGLFSKTRVSTIVAPSGIFDEVLTVPVSNPYLPAAARAQFCADQGISVADCIAAEAATDPDNPAFRTLEIETLRRTPDVGPRINRFGTTVFDYRVGIRGDITDRIRFDLTAAYGESENINKFDNYVLLSRARQAAFATNTRTCIDPGNNCVPVNLFGGPGSITPQQAAFLTAGSTTTNTTSLAQARGLVSGDFGLSSPWASTPINFAAGAEYRKYTAAQSSDLLAQTPGELGGAGGAAPDIKGSYDVYEGFGELNVPIVSDRPFFESLSLETGVRYSHYRVFAAGDPTFNSTTYKAGGSWEPMSGIKVRGNYQRAVRAPDIGALFTPTATGLTNLTVDPCVGAAPTTDANLRAICLAQGAPASSIGLIQPPNSNQANLTSGGNPNLRPEKSDSYTLGVVLTPRRIVAGLTITADYYNIIVNHAVSGPTPADVIGACFNNITAQSAASAACSVAIRRNPGTGQLSGSPATTPGLLAPTTNTGRLKTDGIDVSLTYRRDLGFAKLDLGFQGNWTHRSVFQALAFTSPQFPVKSLARDCVGFYSVNCLSIQPEFSWNQRTTLAFGPVDASLLWRHIDAVKFEPSEGTVFSGPLKGGDLNGKVVDFNRIKAANYFDLAIHVEATPRADLTLTINNLLDRKPPIVGNTIGNTLYNSGNTYPSTYDAIGRNFAVSVRLKF